MDKQTQVDGAVSSESGGSRSVVDVLRQARERVASGWCQRWLAVDSRGHPIHYSDPNACEFCAMGAISVSGNKIDSYFAFDLLRTAIGNESIATWNDDPFRTQRQVVDAFDKAIELAASPAQAPALSSSEGTATQSDSTKEEV